jgi:hypothetical protein
MFSRRGLFRVFLSRAASCCACFDSRCRLRLLFRLSIFRLIALIIDVLSMVGRAVGFYALLYTDLHSLKVLVDMLDLA